MSYYTFTEIDWDDSDRAQGSLTPADVMPLARQYLAAIGWPQDAALDLEQGLQNRGRVDPGFNELRSVQIVDMFRTISETLRDVTFHVRGMGEEILDVWVASVRDGEILVEHGPFDE